VLALVVRNPRAIEASRGARASGVPEALASLSSRPNHVMTVRHGASPDRRLVRAQMTLAAYVPAATSAAERRPRTRRVANATRAMLRSAVDAIGRSAGPMSL